VCQALWDLVESNGDVVNRGLNTHEISVLPTSKFIEKTPSVSSLSGTTVSDDTVNECRICLSQFESNETLRTLPCLHRFHRDCIDNWIQVCSIIHSVFLYTVDCVNADLSNMTSVVTSLDMMV